MRQGHHRYDVCFRCPVLVGCIGKDGGASTDEAVALLQAASKQKDYDRILELADSLEKGGSLSLGESYYWQGYAYYRLSQNMTAEFYFKESMMATENSTDEAVLLMSTGMARSPTMT